MCTVCGCGTDSVEGAQDEASAHEHSHSHTHEHPHDHVHTHEHAHTDGTVHRHAHRHSHAHAHAHSHSHSHAHDHGEGHDHDHAHDGLHADHHPHEHDHDHLHADGVPHEHAHVHDHDHVHASDGTLDYGAGKAGVSVGGLSQARIVRIERDILAQNDSHARDNRAKLAAAGVFAVNLVSSPGSGKTTLLVRTIRDLAGRLPVVVIEGDQQTSNDAARIRATGAPAIQINTGKGCHLDAHMVGHALEQIPLTAGGVLFVENVGNLVCPAAFDLGEAHKIVVLSVTEGEDKPLKYPDMFAAADLMLLNKADLLPHVEFDVAACVANALRVNPRLKTLVVSARTGEGLQAFQAWLEAGAALAKDAARAVSLPGSGPR